MVDLSVTPEQVRSRSNIWLLCSYHVGIRRQEEVPEAPPPLGLLSQLMLVCSLRLPLEGWPSWV